MPRADDRVFLPLDTWLRLRGSNGVPEERGVALLDVRHRLRVQGDEAEVTTTFRVSKRGSGMSRFAIPLGGSGVREARLDGEPVPLLTEGPSPEVVLKKAGDHEIVLVYRVPVDVSREARVVAWQAPAAATGILEADMPGFEGQLRVPGAARVEGEGEHWRVFLGAVAKIEVRLVHAEPREPEVPLRTRAESQIVHRIRHGGVETVDEITLHVLQGDADHVDVALPPGALLLDAGGDGVARWETGQQSVRVVFAQPRQGAVKATVKVFVPAAEPNRETELPALPVLDTTGEGGIVVLDSEPSLRVEAIETTGLFRTATPAKPVAPEDGLLPSDQRVVGAWRFAARPTRFRVRVEELPSRTQANSVIAAVFGQDRVRTFVVLSLDPDARRPVGTFVFALPGTDRVASVRSPGLDNWWTEGEGDGRTLRLRYGDLVAGARTVTLALERRLGGKRDAVMVPRIALRGAVQDAGRLILYALPDVEVAPGALPGLRAVPVELGSVPRPPMADAVARHAFRYEAPLEASLPVSLGSPSPEADAFVVTHVEPSDDVHRLEHLVVFDVRRGLTDRFQLFVPDGGRTDDDLIRAADLREIRETPATRRGPAGEEVAGRLYTVTLQAPRGDLVEITVSQRWRAGTPIRVVRPEGVTTTRWFALVGKFLDGEVRFDTGGAERADWTDLPFVPAGLQPADVVRPVLTARAPYVLDLEARRQAIELSADAVIRAAAAVGVLGRDGEVRVEAVWRLQNRRRQFLRLRLPPHALLYGVTVAGAPVRPLEAPGREILVPVPKVPLGRAGYDVKLLYRAPAGARLPSKDLRFDLPEVLDGVAVDRTIVRLYVPKDFDVQFETDMANASRTDVAADLAEAAVDEANELIEVARTGTYEQRLRAAQQAQVLLQAATVQNRRAEGKRKQVDVDLDRARHAWNEQLSSLRQDRETEARLRANRQVDLYASNSMELLRTAQADETRTQATAGQGGYWTLNGEPPIDKADDGKKDELSKEVSALRARVGQVLLLRQTRANQTAAAPQAQTEAGRAGGAAGGDFDAQAQDQNVQKLNEALRRDQQAKQQLGTTIEAGQRAAVPGDIDVEGTAGYGVSDFVPPTVRLVSPDEVSDQEEPLFGAQVDTGLVLQGLSGAETPGPLVNLDDVTNGVRDGRRGYDHGAAGWTTGAALNGDHGIFYDDSGDGTYAARVENLFDRAMVETATRKGLMGVDVAIPREGRMVQFRATGRGAPITMEARSNEVAPAARWVVFLVLVAGGAGLVFALTRRGARLPKDAGSEPPTSPEATPERNSPAAP